MLKPVRDGEIAAKAEGALVLSLRKLRERREIAVRT